MSLHPRSSGTSDLLLLVLMLMNPMMAMVCRTYLGRVPDLALPACASLLWCLAPNGNPVHGSVHCAF